MVTPWWIVMISGVVVTGVVSFWGWLAVKVIEQGRKLVELEERLNSRQIECEARLAWLRQMQTSLANVREDTAAIRGALNIPRSEKHE